MKAEMFIAVMENTVSVFSWEKHVAYQFKNRIKKICCCQNSSQQCDRSAETQLSPVLDEFNSNGKEHFRRHLSGTIWRRLAEMTVNKVHIVVK